MEKDETETGLREILNFGHTIGHAVEAVSGFALKHGQAVSIGMAAAAIISSRKGLLAESEVARLEQVIRRAGLPLTAPELDINAVMDIMQHDKKVRAGRLRFVLLKSLGHAVVEDVDAEMVKEVLGGWRQA